jgi:hypothetical protein
MSNIPFMTLTEFRATGRDVDQAELDSITGTDTGGEDGGRVYCERLYINKTLSQRAHVGEPDSYCLTIMNDSWVGELRTLEALLYGFARCEMLPKPEDQVQALIDEWQTFCRDEGLECWAAEEMQNHGPINPVQAAYVADFIERWDCWVHGKDPFARPAKPTPAADPSRPSGEGYIHGLEAALRQIRDEYITLDECDIRRIANNALEGKR